MPLLAVDFAKKKPFFALNIYLSAHHRLVVSREHVLANPFLPQNVCLFAIVLLRSANPHVVVYAMHDGAESPWVYNSVA